MIINFTLVFLKGNKTAEELVKMLEMSVADNGTIDSFRVARDSLRLILPSESDAILCILFIWGNLSENSNWLRITYGKLVPYSVEVLHYRRKKLRPQQNT